MMGEYNRKLFPTEITQILLIFNTFFLLFVIQKAEKKILTAGQQINFKVDLICCLFY